MAHYYTSTLYIMFFSCYDHFYLYVFLLIRSKGTDTFAVQVRQPLYVDIYQQRPVRLSPMVSGRWGTLIGGWISWTSVIKILLGVIWRFLTSGDGVYGILMSFSTCLSGSICKWIFQGLFRINPGDWVVWMWEVRWSRRAWQVGWCGQWGVTLGKQDTTTAPHYLPQVLQVL